MTDQRVLDLLTELTDAMAVLLKYCDVGEQVVHDVLAESFRNVVVPDLPESETEPFPLSHRNLLGRMLSYWRTLLAYVDDEGAPLPLPAAGPEPSMQSLFSEAAKGDKSDLTGIDAAVATQLLHKHKSVRSNESGEYVPIAYAFLVNTNVRAGALANLAYLAEYAGSIAHNAHRQQGTRFVAVARVQGFPADQLPLVQAMLNHQGYQFLTDVDSFIESKKVKKNKTAELRDIGIGLYMLDKPHEPDGK